MKSTWVWVAAIVIIAALGGLWWYAQTVPNAFSQIPATGSSASEGSSATTAAAAVSQRDDSDASLNADMSDINGQMTQLNADSAAAAQ